RLTEDVPDVRQELLNRLLSGKKLTGRDEQDIRRLWQETQRKHYALMNPLMILVKIIKLR
ncbi:hypothetical protein QTA21_27765, partial [Escherichia coli]|nr:hypothetical protein [Escherichia coli]